MECQGPSVEEPNSEVGNLADLTVAEAEDAYRAKQKLNSKSLIEELRMEPKNASRMQIPLCRLLPVPKVRPVLVSDVRRLESEFVHGYQEGDRVFFVSTTDDSGGSQPVTDDIVQGWDSHWKKENEAFEKILLSQEYWKSLSGCMFYIWDGNHRHQAWNDYIDKFHSSDAEWHIWVDSIILNSKGRQGALLNAMNDVNK